MSHSVTSTPIQQKATGITSEAATDSRKAGSASNAKESVDVSEKFEALMIHTMIKSMRASLNENSLTGSDQQKMYTELMDAELAEAISKSGGLGLQELIRDDLNISSDNLDTKNNDDFSNLSQTQLEILWQSKSRLQVLD